MQRRHGSPCHRSFFCSRELHADWPVSRLVYSLAVELKRLPYRPVYVYHHVDVRRTATRGTFTAGYLVSLHTCLAHPPFSPCTLPRLCCPVPQKVPEHVTYDEFWTRYFFRAERVASGKADGGMFPPDGKRERDTIKNNPLSSSRLEVLFQVDVSGKYAARLLWTTCCVYINPFSFLLLFLLSPLLQLLLWRNYFLS